MYEGLYKSIWFDLIDDIATPICHIFNLSLLESVSMYVDDFTLYMSATTLNEMTATLNKELQLVSEMVARNKLVLNISKTKSLVFETNYSRNLN